MALIKTTVAYGIGSAAFDNYTHRNALSAALIAELVKAQARLLMATPAASPERLEYVEQLRRAAYAGDVGQAPK